MSTKTYLNAMIKAMISSDMEGAEAALNEAISLKTKILLGESEEKEEEKNCDDCDCDPCECDDDDDDEDDKEDDKKDEKEDEEDESK